MTNPSLSGRGAALRTSGAFPRSCGFRAAIEAEPSMFAGAGRDHRHRVQLGAPRRLFGRHADPVVIFNEKVMAGLGREVARPARSARRRRTGARRAAPLPPADRADGGGATRASSPPRRCATPNGAAFLDAVRAIGFEPRLLSGEEEGRARRGRASSPPSPTPTGSSATSAAAASSWSRSAAAGVRAQRLAAARRAAPRRAGRGREDAFASTSARPWRSRARRAQRRPALLHGRRQLARPGRARHDADRSSAADHPSASRWRPHGRRNCGRPCARPTRTSCPRALHLVEPHPDLPIATQLLEALVVVLDPKALIVSSFGIREGLLYHELAPDEQALDPLIEAAREAGAGLGRFAQHGGLLDGGSRPSSTTSP